MKHFLPIAVVGLLVVGCHRDRPAAIPRQRAYPRVEVYPQTYSPHTLESIVVEVNDSALTSISGTWMDVTYPVYGLTVNCTLTPVNAMTLRGVIDNRTERMALNLGGSSAQVITLVSESGWTAQLIEATGRGGLTPLQFMATDSSAYVLSGVVTAESSDSLRPALESVKADILHLLQKL